MFSWRVGYSVGAKNGVEERLWVDEGLREMGEVLVEEMVNQRRIVSSDVDEVFGLLHACRFDQVQRHGLMHLLPA